MTDETKDNIISLVEKQESLEAAHRDNFIAKLLNGRPVKEAFYFALDVVTAIIEQEIYKGHHDDAEDLLDEVQWEITQLTGSIGDDGPISFEDLEPK